MTDAAVEAPIDVGTVLLLDAGRNTPRIKSRLVGIAPSEFLVFQPMEWGPEAALALASGRVINVRHVQGGLIVGFRCTSFGVSEKPRALIFLSFPALFEEQSRRAHARVACALPAVLQHDGRSRAARLIDLSPVGCLCVLRRAAGEVSMGFEAVGTEIGLSLMLPGVAGSVAVSARVRNVTPEGVETRFGLSFESPPPPAIAAFLQSVGDPAR